jgi:hypothetical protein
MRVRHSASGMPEEEQLSHYVSSSDLAYITVVVSIYRRRELQGGKRQRCRTQGQKGMMQKKQYRSVS